MERWVSTWGNAEAPAVVSECTTIKDTTLRYNVPIMVSGSKVRLLFSNKFGAEKLVLDRVTLGKNSIGSAEATTRDEVIVDFKKVTFGGKKKAKIGAGESLWSDEIDYEVKKGDFLAVSIYIKDARTFSTATSVAGRYSYGNFVRGKGVTTETFPLYVSRDTATTAFLYGVDVLVEDEESSSIVCFGDSITAQFWPDELAYLLLNSDKNIGVVRKGIGGNRILRTYKHFANLHYGEAGVLRIDSDLDKVSGAKAVVVLHGINDIIHPDGSTYRPLEELPTAEEIINAYEEKYIASAKRHGLKIYFATILPFKGWHSYCQEREDIRTAVNNWIKTTDKIDGYIDFASVVKSEEDETMIIPSLTGDHLHPNPDGAKRMAKIAYEVLFSE
jgi:lysophospholipase L1-like esterase